MKKNNKTLSLVESFKINISGIKLLMNKYPKMLISKIIYIIFSTLTPYIDIYLLALIVDELALGKNKERLYFLTIITLVQLLVFSLINALLKSYVDTVCSDSYLKINKVLSDKMLEMDFVNVDDIKTHELLSTIAQNQNGGGWGLFHLLFDCENLLSSLLTVIAGLGFTVTLFIRKVPSNNTDLQFLNMPLISVLVIVLLLLVTFLSPILQTKGSSYYAKASNEHNLGNRFFSFFGFLGMRKKYAADIRFYHTEKICDYYNSNKESTFGSNGLFSKLCKGPIGIYSALGAAVSQIFILIIYTYVGLKALGGAFGIGTVTQYIAAITKVSTGLSLLVGTVGGMKNNASFLKLIFDFLNISSSVRVGHKKIINNQKYVFEFKNVYFKYPNTEEYVLKNINVKFDSLEKIAVVGENGSGKSTFIKLLCRLYDVSEGEILLNGVDIREYDYDEYLKAFAVVFQDFNLLALPLGQNVASGTNYDEDMVTNCLLKAGFKNRLDKMKDGLATNIYKDIDKNGVELSGGEAQKVALARALYKNSPFIILDEPTAALDPIAEEEIYNNFNNIVEDKMAIYISHRLSSCKFCNDIIVFDNGKIVERGNHQELVENTNSKYYELWEAQAKYYNN